MYVHAEFYLKVGQTIDRETPDHHATVSSLEEAYRVAGGRYILLTGMGTKEDYDDPNNLIATLRD